MRRRLHQDLPGVRRRRRQRKWRGLVSQQDSGPHLHAAKRWQAGPVPLLEERRRRFWRQWQQWGRPRWVGPACWRCRWYHSSVRLPVGRRRCEGQRNVRPLHQHRIGLDGCSSAAGRCPPMEVDPSHDRGVAGPPFRHQGVVRQGPVGWHRRVGRLARQRPLLGRQFRNAHVQIRSEREPHRRPRPRGQCQRVQGLCQRSRLSRHLHRANPANFFRCSSLRRRLPSHPSQVPPLRFQVGADASAASPHS
mmetsp:Transcript_31869/g.93652  ORF Transcript_31869/g.93652 Transcript_31869/m.93652 type:complete len:249 (+) Transcript_31869:712-1458(+)